MGEILTIADMLEAGFLGLSVVVGTIVVFAAARMAPKMRLPSHRLALIIFFAAAGFTLASECVGVFASFSRPSTFADAAEEFVQFVSLCLVGVGLRLMSRAEREEVSPLIRSANLDELTGLANRSFFLPAAYRRIERFKDYGTPLSCVVLDVDDFKPYNDRYGHEAGDRALQSVARVLSEEVRAEDLVARYGGEEFIILAGVEMDDAAELAERVRRRVEGECVPERKGSLLRRITVSLGIASLSDGRQTLGQLVRAADAAMYHSKRTGKNRVSVIEDVRAS